MIVIENKYDLGQTVYLATDPDQKPRIVTGILQRPSGLLYALASGTEERFHFEIEIAETKDVVISTSS